MSPEQAQGKPLDARADVYSLGATLFHLLTGRPPFVADSPLAVMGLHANQPPPPLRSLQPDASDAVCQIIDKCLAKSKESRYPDAAAMLRDLDRLLRGEPTAAEAHPKLPDCDARKLLRYDWTWNLEASPDQLWPLVCNTERFNRAAGLPPVRWTTKTDADGKVHRFGEFRKAGFTATWEEFPFEWIEGRRFGVLRRYQGGPFKWMVGIFELAPKADGGTQLTARVRIEPTGFLGRTVAALEVGINGKRAMDRVYRRFDAALTGKLGDGALVDPFEEPAALPGARRRRLETLLDRLGTAGVEATVVERLGDYLATAPAQEVTRIRPLALARRLALDADQVLAACLHAARLGLLVLLWDILCPVCRIPSEVKDGLKSLTDHGRCEACNLDYDLDFANSVEMIFRVHPEVRDAELGVYCIGGPAHSPHVAAQVRVSPREVFELEMALGEGQYRLRGPQLPFAFDFRVQAGTVVGRWDVPLPRGPEQNQPRVLRTGHQTLALINESDAELVVRVERTAARADALTAARASALALFRELFPGEVLSPGQLVSVATVTLLVIDIADAESLYRELGDARAFAILHEYFRRVADRVKQDGGAVIKTVGEAVVAAFTEPLPAVRTALDLRDLMASHETLRRLRPRMGVHRGPAMAATLNDHLDYFGTTANTALRLPELAEGDEVVLSQEVSSDPQVSDLIRSRELKAEPMTISLAGLFVAVRLRRE
jgi:class 3 adenylate cyclase